MGSIAVVPPASAIRVLKTSSGYVLRIVIAPATQPESSFSPYKSSLLIFAVQKIVNRFKRLRACAYKVHRALQLSGRHRKEGSLFCIWHIQSYVVGKLAALMYSEACNSFSCLAMRCKWMTPDLRQLVGLSFGEQGQQQIFHPIIGCELNGLLRDSLQDSESVASPKA